MYDVFALEYFIGRQTRRLSRQFACHNQRSDGLLFAPRLISAKWLPLLLLFCLYANRLSFMCLLCAQPITQIMRWLCVYAYTAPGVIEEKTNLPLPPSAERVCFHYVNSRRPDR